MSYNNQKTFMGARIMTKLNYLEEVGFLNCENKIKIKLLS